MSISSILREQWSGYPEVHANRANFVVHLMTVPIFMAGTVFFFWGLSAWSVTLALAGLIAMMMALGAQAWGHKQESQPPEPFSGPLNAVVRLVLEQWVTFPRYAWRRAAGASR